MKEKYAIHHFCIINISFFLFFVISLRRSFVDDNGWFWEGNLHSYSSMCISFIFKQHTLHCFATQLARISSSQQKKIYDSKSALLQFTHRSWFPLTRNKNYIKSYSWESGWVREQLECIYIWKIVINDEKTIILSAE